MSVTDPRSSVSAPYSTPAKVTEDAPAGGSQAYRSTGGKRKRGMIETPGGDTDCPAWFSEAVRVWNDQIGETVGPFSRQLVGDIFERTLSAAL